MFTEKAADNAHILTYAGAGSTFVLWGLNLSDIGIIVSMTCAVIGVLIQLIGFVYKLRELQRSQVATNDAMGVVERRQDAADVTVSAVAASNRANAQKAAVADAKADVAISVATNTPPPKS